MKLFFRYLRVSDFYIQVEGGKSFGVSFHREALSLSVCLCVGEGFG